MGQEVSQQQQQHHNHNHNHNLNLNQNLKRAQPPHRKNNYNKDPIYTPASNISTSSSTDDYDANYRLRHKYNLTKQTYERSKILASNSNHRSSTQSDSDSHYAKINNNNSNIGSNNNNIVGGKFLQRSSSSSQSSDSGIYNSSCHCSSLSSLSSSAVSSSSASSSSGCPSSLASSKSNRSLDKQKQYLSHHLYIKSYLDILEEDERARAHFKAARPGGIRNYTPKILGGGSETTVSNCSKATTLSVSAPAASFGLYRNPSLSCKQRGSSGGGVGGGAGGTAVATAVGSGRNYQEDPWI